MFGVSTAVSGVGTTARVSFGLRHGLRLSREAAPKQRWRASGETDSVTCILASPLSGRRSSQPAGGGHVVSSRYWLRATQ